MFVGDLVHGAQDGQGQPMPGASVFAVPGGGDDEDLVGVGVAGVCDGAARLVGVGADVDPSGVGRVGRRRHAQRPGGVLVVLGGGVLVAAVDGGAPVGQFAQGVAVGSPRACA